MVYFRQIFLMIIVVAISLQCCSISADERYRTQIGKLVGEDGGEKRKFAVLEKFKALLDLIKPSTPRRRNLAASPWPAPSPSPYPNGGPVESPAYSPAPQRPIPPHLRRPLPQRTHPPGQHEIQSRKHEKGGVFVPLVVSTACGIGFVVCVVVVLCLCLRVRKKNGKTLSFKRKQRKSQKVSINPTLDFLYLNSVGVDLERQSSVPVKETENDDELREEEVKTSMETEILLDSDNAGSYSTKEIVSVQENGDDKTEHSVSASEEDDESFHSVGGGSQYSNPRLSNASSSSVSGIGSSQRFSERELDIPEHSGISHPPPPPPPPLPHFSNRGLLHTLSSQETAKPQTLSSQLSAKVSASSSKPLPPPPPPPPRSLQQPQVTNKTPPPPLSLDFSQRTPLGKDGAPLPKLKPLHWDKVRATPDRTMVWDKIRTSSFEFDEEMIESLFGYTMQTSTKNEDGRCKTPSPGKHLLEPKRLQNFTILLKALNATADQICSALGKGEGLCLQQLEALVKMVPTKEEELKLCSYKGAVDELGSAEKFLRALVGVPFAFQRAEAMLYRETFEDEVVHLRNSFSMLEEACKELKSSRLFLKLLEAVLKTGNRMNVGTIRGGAKAFKLDALLKLSDVKGTDGKTTLLHFVVQEISRSEGIRVSDSIMGRIMNQRPNKNRTAEEKEEDYRRMGLDLVSGLNTELRNVKKTATIDLEGLVSSVSNLRDGLEQLRCLASNEENRAFVSSMNSFLRYGEKSLEELREDEERIMERVGEIAEYFHGDVRGDDKNPLRIFVIVRDFLGMLDQVCRELRCVRVPNSPSPLAPFR
ncbi:PREDICTED: formin-like protein 11 [Brassica oleracea var. oleracea]|uniref:Formin-like protein n=1 Tax=Brassica oleracea var. oleracea TaxID=109376 RepID=A0A0D3CMK5_BRAOL|nr:PREDICTED: formin-like protein 11 [Brassica oleracea var. oleracea]XP_013638742.1 PREDICTED: formin-like protein 11 [Brassica oleracea var. oleracea]